MSGENPSIYPQVFIIFKHPMRQNLTILLLLLLGNATFAQNGAFPVGHLPDKGLVLDSGWVFQPGDDPARAQPGFNDRDWKPLNPADELHHLPPIRDAEIGWFRLRLHVDSTLRGKSVATLITGFGAIEIYFNGKHTYQFGHPSGDYNKEQTRFFTNKLLSLTFSQAAEQVIAIRYSFNKRNLYVKFANKRPITRIVLKEINEGFADHAKENSFDSTLRAIQVSFYLPLGFLLLFLYISFRPMKEYLYAGIFCFSLFLAMLLHIFALADPVTANRSNICLLGTQVFYIIGAIAFLHSIYLLYKLKKNWFFYLIVLYGLFTLPFYFISYDSSGLVNAFFFPVINLEFMRLNFMAVTRHRKGAWILLLTSIVFAVTVAAYIFFSIAGEDRAAALMQSISFIIPGIGLSIFYAGEFARTASAERQRATEVERLSQEMIEKEREKQLILGEQNETLEKRVAEQTAELRKSLQDLKETEQQLIQREKMASLGELTAGIAHEIQNPLNFVNNFSDINTELIDEMMAKLEEGKKEEAAALATDLKQNNEKISFHGKRADSIVKGMLQHSRNSSEQKEPTDINNLVDECLRLSFHGMRAKDKSFNAKTAEEFDPELPKANVVPQDIGRVLLNIFTNAFYSVLQKRKTAGPDYEPLVSVKTSYTGGKLIITIRDNGKGIPHGVLDKIYQPFFTTKPAGQGTGLGLSMSYEIITRGHGGELKVETKEGEFAAFTILLPI